MKNRFSHASVFLALIGVSFIILFNQPDASATPAERLSQSFAPSGEKDCNFWTCPIGCCDASGNCRMEWSSEYCGYYGEDCSACDVPTPYCFNEGVYAQCTACNFLTCPGGCCGSDGYCHDDNNPEFCGFAGADCDACAQPTPNCIAGSCAGCDGWTCPIGCCDPDNYCHIEENSEYCGYYGEDCNACTVPTPYCFDEGVYAQCTDCNILTCPIGCCGSDGYCHEENSPEFCGLGGGSCDTCTTPNPNCVVGLCVGCDAIFCPVGCCDPENLCHNENNADFCGIAGTSCGACVGDTPNCYNGWCVGCSDQFPCPDGCCEMRTSVCHPGNTNEECGGVGSSCGNCEIDDLFCQNGQCVGCNAETCSDGCCDSNGACRPGTENNFCGTGAAGCINCVSSGEICVDDICAFAGDDTGDDADDDIDDDGDDTDYPACGPDNCLAGCCLNGQCWPGDADDKCGLGANACENCLLNDEICQNNKCVVSNNDDTSGDDDTSDDDSVADDDTGTTDDDSTTGGGGRSSSGSCGC